MRYLVLQGNEQLFASKYKLVLPGEEELRAELDRERAVLDERLLNQNPQYKSAELLGVRLP